MEIKKFILNFNDIDINIFYTNSRSNLKEIGKKTELKIHFMHMNEKLGRNLSLFSLKLMEC